MRLRLIPSIQIHLGDAVKTERFGAFRYVGSPMNAVSIFSALGADEIQIVGLDAARGESGIDFDTLTLLSSASRVPLSYSGGLGDRASVERVFNLGFERVYFGRAIYLDPELVRWAVAKYGSQAVGAVGDFSRSGSEFFLRPLAARTELTESPASFYAAATALGVGEILLTRWDREGSLSGLDLEILSFQGPTSRTPVLLGGGFAGLAELANLPTSITGVSAGTFFTFSGPKRAVLLNYPSQEELQANTGFTELAYKGEYSELETRSPTIQTEIELGHSMCPKCLITDSVPGANLTSQECQYCQIHDRLERVSRATKFRDWASQIKADSGADSDYDCILGVSGGADSSFLLHLLAEQGIRVLAVHFDNGWNSPESTMNIHRVTSKLGIDLETHVADHREYDRLYKAFLLSGVRDIEAPTDIAFMSVLYRSAQDHKIKHIVEGHSFRTEGTSPLQWLYMDGAYVESVYRERWGRAMQSYPSMRFTKFLYWSLFAALKRHRPLYYFPYDKGDAREMLAKNYGWKWYGGHHLENRFTAFFHSYFLPARYGIDYRQIELSALVRSGFMDRAQAKLVLAGGRAYPKSALTYIERRLGMDGLEDFLKTNPQRHFSDFRNYKGVFRKLRPVFWLLMKAGRVPETFYIKYCAS